MLALCYIGLRFIHFGALMLIFGNALYSVWFAPSSIQRLMSRRFQLQQKVAAFVSGGCTPDVYASGRADG